MNPKLALGLGVVFLLLASNAVVGFKAYNFGKDATQAKWDAAELEREKALADANAKITTDRKKVKHENQNRDHDALVRYGCSRGWVRDFENCPTDSR